jgi:hypothetical protein
MDIFDELRTALRRHDEWPTNETAAQVIDLARRFVRAVDQRADVIDYYRQNVTPSEEALSELLPSPDYRGMTQ